MIDALQDPVVKYYLSACLAAWPVYRICRRAGFSGRETVLLAIPFAGFILCAGSIALRRWPPKQEGSSS